MSFRPLHSLHSASNLLALTDLLSSNARILIDEWAKENDHARVNKTETAPPLPSQRLHAAQRTVLAIVGALTELVSEPSSRIIETACEYWESRAVSIAAERRIPDYLAKNGGPEGVAIEEISQYTGIEVGKLARILRCLCSNGIFREVADERFANNRISEALVGNEPLRAYVLMFNLDLYTASDHLPSYLLGEQGASYKVEETAFQTAVGTKKPRWDWLEEKVVQNDLARVGAGYPGMPGLKIDEKESNVEAHSVMANGQVNGTVHEAAQNGVSPKEKETKTANSVSGQNGTEKTKAAALSRPELEVFGLAMLGGGKVFGAAHPYDYPWADLGKATIVDVGGGVGGFSAQLSLLYPDLQFVIQDRGPVLKQAEHTVWPKENPSALAANRVTFMQHDFFEPNPVKNAEVYWFRYILHDWSDDYCVRILNAIRVSMTSPNSRILVCDQVMNTTLGCQELEPAPHPLLANYGTYTRYSHQRDLAMMGIINGIERTPKQFKAIVEKAGLRIEKIWECRSQVSIVEIRLA